jgi:hypothetical protein
MQGLVIHEGVVFVNRRDGRYRLHRGFAMIYGNKVRQSVASITANHSKPVKLVGRTVIGVGNRSTRPGIFASVRKEKLDL